MCKVEVLSISYGDKSPNKMPISLRAYTRSRPAAKQSSNFPWLSWNLKRNWNQNSLSVFIPRFQACNKLSAAVTVYPLAPTLQGKPLKHPWFRNIFFLEICVLSPAEISVNLLLLMLTGGRERAVFLLRFLFWMPLDSFMDGILPLGFSALDSRKCFAEWFSLKCLSHSTEIRVEILIRCFKMSFKKKIWVVP